MTYPIYPNYNFIYPAVREYPLASVLVSGFLIILVIIILSSIGGEKKWNTKLIYGKYSL